MPLLGKQPCVSARNDAEIKAGNAAKPLEYSRPNRNFEFNCGDAGTTRPQPCTAGKGTGGAVGGREIPRLEFSLRSGQRHAFPVLRGMKSRAVIQDFGAGAFRAAYKQEVKIGPLRHVEQGGVARYVERGFHVDHKTCRIMHS